MDDHIRELTARVDALSDLVRATNQPEHSVDHTAAIEALQDDLKALRVAQQKAGPDAITRSAKAAVAAEMRRLPDAIVPPIKDRINAVERIAENAAVDARREAEIALHDLSETVKRSLAAHELKATMAVATLRAFIAEDLAQ